MSVPRVSQDSALSSPLMKNSASPKVDFDLFSTLFLQSVIGILQRWTSFVPSHITTAAPVGNPTIGTDRVPVEPRYAVM